MRAVVACKLVAEGVPQFIQEVFKHSFSNMLRDHIRWLKVNWVDSDVVWSVILYAPAQRVDASRVLMSIPTTGTVTPADASHSISYCLAFSIPAAFSNNRAQIFMYVEWAIAVHFTHMHAPFAAPGWIRRQWIRWQNTHYFLAPNQ
jgi:hypothetical protein